MEPDRGRTQAHTGVPNAIHRGPGNPALLPTAGGVRHSANCELSAEASWRAALVLPSIFRLSFCYNYGVQRPAGVVAISVLFFLASAYLTILAVVWFVDPEVFPLSFAAPLLHGLELAGPYMFLICAAVGTIVGVGLLRLNNYARRATILIAIAGIVMLIPKMSAAAVDISAELLIVGIQVIVRVVIVWYLWQKWTAEEFH